MEWIRFNWGATNNWNCLSKNEEEVGCKSEEAGVWSWGFVEDVQFKAFL